MNTKVFLLSLSIALLSLTSACAQTKTEQFKVYGKCEMCEKRIETAAKSVSGVNAADWDLESQTIKVSFNASKTDIHKINMAIIKVGHDTNMHKAKDEVYNSLPACCKYERVIENENTPKKQ